MRVEDYGKVAATFIDTQSGRGVRIAPRRTARQEAVEFAPEARNRWEAMLLGYQRMPDERLLQAQDVALTSSIETIVSRPRKRAICSVCGEEIMNEREVVADGKVLCKACAGQSYYLLRNRASSSQSQVSSQSEQAGPKQNNRTMSASGKN
jgi:formylmethanofuran dehydrogenase subunit E